MKPIFFSSPETFREWLAANHQSETELLVGFYKVGSGKPSMSWSQSVDQALCYGWIDGIRKSVDAESYTIRFTPRRPKSVWSAVNVKKMDTLEKSGLMTDAGRKAYAFLAENKSRIYSYEKKEDIPLSAEFERKFKMNQPAWEFFVKQPPGYKKLMIHWIMGAKQEQTRLSRLEKTIAENAQQKRIR